MADFRFFLDGVQVTEPKNWESFTIGYVRVLDTRGATISQPEGDLVFFNDGYDALKTLWDDNGTCGQADFKIEYRDNVFTTYATLFEGIIRAVDIEFDLFNCTATVAQVVDNSYIALINANADARAFPNVGRSKNDVAITAVTAINLSFFNPGGAVGSYIYTNRKCYRVFDVFEFLVAFCTDGGLTFASDFFDTGGEGEGIFIATGKALGGTTDEPPFISFAELLLEMHYLFNVVVVIDDSGASPVIRVEKASDTYVEQVTQQFQSTELRGLKNRAVPFGAGQIPYNGDKPISVFTDLVVGSEVTLDDSGGWAYPDVRWVSHKEESYHLLGDCAFRQTLKMVNSYVIDSNVFEDLLTTPSTAYDSNIFVFETDYPTFNRATKFDIFTPGAPPYTYNDGLTNANRMARFVGAVPDSIAAYLGNGNDGFEANDSTVPRTINVIATNIDPYPFNDDTTPPSNDPNGNYDAVTNYRYTAPANGIYSFEVRLSFTNVIPVPAQSESWDFNILVRRYNAGGTLIETRTYSETNRSTAGDVTYAPTAFYLDATDYVDVRYEHSANGGGPGIISYDIDEAIFSAPAVQTGGGIYQTIDVGSFRGNYHIFDVPMSFADFLAMVDYSQRFDAVFVNFGDTSKDITGWIVQARYKIGQAGGMATIELVSAI